MNRDFFSYLPSEIIIDILSRLPIHAIISCKRVCKSWRDLLKTHEFAKSHLSKSIPGMTIFKFKNRSNVHKILEFEDGLDVEHHELHYNIVTKFSFPYGGWISGSANGLLFLEVLGNERGFYICNPITCDYIKMQCPQEFVFSDSEAVTFGFGVSKMTGLYKVVRILYDSRYDEGSGQLLEVFKCDCHVHTLGTGSWRSIAPVAPFEYNCDTIGAFFNGNLHWMIYDLKGPPQISCFDLETELFSTFNSLPPFLGTAKYYADVFAFGDYLCLCDNTSNDGDMIVIWMMKEYGVEKSWIKEFVFSRGPNVFGGYGLVYPVKVFKDGDILVEWEGNLFRYSNKTETAERIEIFHLRAPYDRISAINHTASFISLRSFGIEDVSSF